MILIGQYDSSFVRRVGIALTLYGIGFEHRPWSVFGDAARIAGINPLTRVPTLVLDDGAVLVDSPTMIDHMGPIYECDPDSNVVKSPPSNQWAARWQRRLQLS